MASSLPRGPGRIVAVVFLVWAPFWLAYSHLVLTAVRQLDVVGDPLTRPGPALAYGALAMGLALLLALTAWWRILSGWLRRDGLAWNLGVELVHALLFTALWVVGVELLVVPLFYGESPFPILDTLARTPYRSARIFNGLFLYTAAAGLAHAFRFFRESREAAIRAEQAERLATRSRLEALRAQLQPHFLFNALNAISELVHEDVAAADDAIMRLSRLLQRVLEEERETHPLAEELALIRDYVTLERIRFGERLVFTESLAPDSLRCHVPAFAVHGLVENAIRHAVGPSAVPVSVILVSELDPDGQLVITVQDDGGSGGTGDPGSGLGLENLRERLAVSYGSSATLRTRIADAGFVATLSLPTGGD